MIGERGMIGDLAGGVVITGGGTAGHTNPGIAVAQALVDLGFPRAKVHFVGGARGNEGTLVTEAGFSIDLLPGRGFARSLRPAALTANAGAARALVAGFVGALRILRRRRPAAVLCLGGYAAAPISMAAVLTRVPVVVTEQNARASAVNRLIGRFATECALPYPGVDLPKGVLTGNPIRPSVVDAVRRLGPGRAKEVLGLPSDRVVVAVWSGSLGARSVNRAVRALAEKWADRDDARSTMSSAAVTLPSSRTIRQRCSTVGLGTGQWSTRTECPNCLSPPTSPFAAPGRRPRPNSPWPACHRSSFHFPGRRGTTKRQTPRSSSAPAAHCCSPTPISRPTHSIVSSRHS